ncbi:MAG: hypothetical protein A2122_00130 [Candidatus Liptonbacteria bacterium GWB1_49_6]|uniref:Uncharacterized protein n=1 Tax=Candidatus Liptonbacteria bacterium GWB1_49_6 TaxID=1798644 RepID=A0A1G2C4Z5_9BACT|nr:MAG: hypothetical protein A2122_00130 [Candidatus Liptonbacteria bacterium GWB1_49_6]
MRGVLFLYLGIEPKDAHPYRTIYSGGSREKNIKFPPLAPTRRRGKSENREAYVKKPTARRLKL